MCKISNLGLQYTARSDCTASIDVVEPAKCTWHCKVACEQCSCALAAATARDLQRLGRTRDDVIAPLLLD